MITSPWHGKNPKRDFGTDDWMIEFEVEIQRISGLHAARIGKLRSSSPHLARDVVSVGVSHTLPEPYNYP